MSNPRPVGAGMGPEWGAEREIQGLGEPIAGTQVPEDAPMDLDMADESALERLSALLTNTRAQLARAVEEANEMQAWSSDEVRSGPSLESAPHTDVSHPHIHICRSLRLPNLASRG